jgi:hypothetical protein
MQLRIGSTNSNLAEVTRWLCFLPWSKAKLPTTIKQLLRKSHLGNNAEVVHIAANDLKRRSILQEGVVLEPEPP